MAAWLETIFATYAQSVPIEIIVFLASIIEELIPPIPAFPITILAGNFAQVQDYTLLGLFIVVVIGAIGKTIGAILIYYLVKTANSIFISKYGRFFGVNETDINRFDKYLNGNWRDYLILTSLRTVPVIPSAIITVGSGVIGVPIKIYIIATLIGSVLRYSMYMYAGYFGSELLINYLTKFETGTTSKTLTILFAFALIGFFLVLFLRNKQNSAN